MPQSTGSRKTPLAIDPVLGTTLDEISTSLGEVGHPSEASHPCQGRNKRGHNFLYKTGKCNPFSETDLRTAFFNPTEATERERKTRKSKLKLSLELKCQNVCFFFLLLYYFRPTLGFL